jgi:aryl-alcohol dehydrogenase-like predicted oxidoreductase
LGGFAERATLSQIAVGTLLATPGVSVVLLGMRSADYVADALNTLRLAPVPDPAGVYSSLDRDDGLV